MWQDIIYFINHDPIIGGAISSFLGNTLSTPISEGLRKLFQKKQEEKVLTMEGCQQIGIKEEDLKAILDELKQLRNNKIVIRQENEEGDNDNEINGFSNVSMGVEISQTNKKGDNSLKISL